MRRRFRLDDVRLRSLACEAVVLQVRDQQLGREARRENAQDGGYIGHTLRKGASPLVFALCAGVGRRVDDAWMARAYP